MRALPFKIPIISDESFMVQEDLQPYFYGILHTHPEVQITLILESTGTLFAGDFIGEFKPGDLFIIGSNCPHVFKNEPNHYSDESTLVAHSISLFLGTHFLDNQILELSETDHFKQFLQSMKVGMRTQIVNHPDLREKFHQIREESGLERLIILLQIIQLISNLKNTKSLMHSPLKKEVSELEGKRLKEIFDYTIQNFTRPITIEEISDVAVMTPQSFCRFFKRSTRKTYVQFMNELRINHAVTLLKKNELSISGVAHQSGFNNLSHFNRQFLKSKQVTPSSYRKNLANKINQAIVWTGNKQAIQ